MPLSWASPQTPSSAEEASPALAFLTKEHKEKAATPAAQLPGLEACLASLCRLLEMNHDKIKFFMRGLTNRVWVGVCVCLMLLSPLTVNLWA